MRLVGTRLNYSNWLNVQPKSQRGVSGSFHGSTGKNSGFSLVRKSEIIRPEKNRCFSSVRELQISLNRKSDLDFCSNKVVKLSGRLFVVLWFVHKYVPFVRTNLFSPEVQPEHVPYIK